MRAVIGALLVWAWCRYRGIALTVQDGTLAAGTLAGALFGLEFLTLYIGLEHTTVARATLLVNTMPFWVLVGGHFLLGEDLSVRKTVGLLLAFAGMVTVFSDRLGPTGATAFYGDLLVLSAGLLWALTNIVIKRSRLNGAVAEKLLLYQLAGSILVGTLALPFAGQIIREPGASSVLALLFQGVFIVAFTYVVWFWLLRRYPASGLASFTFLTPAFGVLCGGILLGEPLGARLLIALVLIAAGLIIVNRPPRRPPDHARP